MEYLILILFVLSVWHFACESIIAPSMRSNIRCDLYRLKDELDEIDESNGKSFPKEARNILSQGIDFYTERVSKVTISFIFNVAKALSNKDFKMEVDRRAEVIGQAKHDGVLRVRDALSREIKRAFIVNSLGWGIFVVPIGLFATMLKKFWSLRALALPKGSADDFMSNGTAFA